MSSEAIVFDPISGAHFNPAVTPAFEVRREIGARTAAERTAG